MQKNESFLSNVHSSSDIPVCFAYIIPMSRNGGIPREQLELPKRPFAVMGGLDAMVSANRLLSLCTIILTRLLAEIRLV